AHADGATVLYGACDEDLVMAYQPVVEALSHYVESAPEAVWADLEQQRAELGRLVPHLAWLGAPRVSPAGIDPETDRHRLFEAVADLLAAISKADSLLLVLDDLHWADPPTLLLLRHLLRK